MHSMCFGSGEQTAGSFLADLDSPEPLFGKRGLKALLTEQLQGNYSRSLSPPLTSSMNRA